MPRSNFKSGGGSSESDVQTTESDNKLIAVLLKGQSEIKEALQQTENRLKKTFDDKIQDLRQDIQGKINNITDRVDDLDTKVAEIEGLIKNNSVPARESDLRVVITNLIEPENETYQLLLDSVKEIIQATEVSCTVVDVKRCEYSTRIPKLVVVTLSSNNEREKLLKFCYKLKSVDKWKQVYINCDKTR